MDPPGMLMETSGQLETLNVKNRKCKIFGKTIFISHYNE